MNRTDFRNAIRRRAIVMDVGGFRPPEDPLTSWFGRVSFALPGEPWPHAGTRPMHALCQIVLRDLPFVPPRLDDMAMLCVFIADDLPTNQPNGENWCLRTYPDLDDVVPLPARDTGSAIKPLPLRPRVVEEDFPCWEDIPIEVPPECDANYYDEFENVSGLKLGGWPTLIQSEIFWAPWNEHPAKPEYVFQIDSTEKGNWVWGDSGIGYFGRGTAPGCENDWALEWQCY
jgi:uncharacterized protein YwqG